MGSQDKNKPSIRQFEYFVSIAMSSNFRKAADKLNVSQPTLTSQVAALEEALGIRLFERSRAGTLLSPAGRELLPLTRQLLEQYQQILDQAGTTGKELSGIFKIGVPPTVGPYLFPSVLSVLHRRYPKLKLHIREDVPHALEQGLTRGEYDFIITMLPMHSSDNRVRALFSEPVSIVVPEDSSLARGDFLEGKDLYNRPVLTIDQDHHLHHLISTMCERYNAQLQLDFAGTSLNTLKQMVMQGMGLAFLPALYIRSSIVAGDRLKVMSLKGENISRTHVASWRRNSPSRHLFQKISYDIKSVAMDVFSGMLEEVNTEENSETVG